VSHACVNPAEHQPKDLTAAVVAGRMARHQARVAELLARYPVKRGALLQALWLVQEEFGWVPREAIKWAADTSAVSHAHAFGVTEFYTMYRQVPAGKHLVQVCQTMACYQQGAEDLIAHLETSLGVHCGETTPDGLFTLVRVECLALCGSGPGVMIDDQAIGPEPHALGGAGDLREGCLEVSDFHPTSAVLERWLAFLRAEHQRQGAVRAAGGGLMPPPGDALGRLVLSSLGHPGAAGATAQVQAAGYAPAPPALKLAAAAVGEAISLSWLNDPGCTRIVVERSDDGGASWRVLCSPSPKDQKAADKLPEGVTAHYRVLAFERERAARPSAVAAATGKPPPPPPPSAPAGAGSSAAAGKA
jgi:NADH:ubiquinone oxidoreductase subunit E